ncbi:unnamed protein product [Closterium sp. NIES-54]
MVTTTTPGGQRVSICTCTWTGRHMATFTRRPGSSLYTLTTEPPQVAAFAQVSAAGPVATPSLCRLLSHQTLLWHHRLGHPSLPRLHGMHSRLLGPGCVCGQDRDRYFLLLVDDYTRYTTVFPLRCKGEVPSVLIPWFRAVRLQLHERFREDLPVLCVHNDRGGEFSSDLLRDFCHGEGILQSFTLPASPQKNGAAERRIGLVMEVARTSMIYAAAPHFMWPFAVRYAAHQLNLWPRVSLPETLPTLRWTGKVGDASVFQVWGSRAFVRDTSADKLSSRAIPCVFLGFPTDAPGWQFYHPTSRCVLPSQKVTFDKSVPFYRLFPYRIAPLPLPPLLFFALGPPLVDPLPPQGPASSYVSLVDPLPGTVPVEVSVDSGATRGTASRGAASGGAEPASAEPGGAEPEGAESGGAESGGAEPGGAEPGGAEPEGAELGSAESEGAESRGAEPRGIASSGGPAGASPRLSPRPEPLSPQQLREWLCLEAAVGTGAGGARAVSVGGAGGTAGAGGTGGARAAGSGGARTTGTVAAGAGGVGDPGAGGTDAGGARAGGTRARHSGAEDTGTGGARAGGAGDPGAGGAGADRTGAGGTVQRRPFFVPPPPSSLPPLDSVLRQVLSLPSSTGLPPSLLSSPPHQSQPQLQPDSPLPAPSPYVEQTDSLIEHRVPESHPASPVRAVRTCRRVPRPHPPPVPGTHIMALRPSSVPLRVPLPPPPTSSLPAVPDPKSDLARAASPIVPRLLATVVTDPSFESTAASTLVAELVEFPAACRLDYATSLVAKSESECPPFVEGECALGMDILEERQEDFECLTAAIPHLVAMLLAPEGDPNAPDILTPRSYTEAITGPYSSQWQTAMDTEIASTKSTGTYVNAVPPSWGNIVDGMWTFTVKRPPGSPPVFKARYSDYKLHSLDFSTAFLQGSLHEEIWLRRPRGFTGSFPAGTQWSLRRPVYGLRQAPCEWHDTLRTTLAALGFAPSTADPSLPPFYVLVYVDDLVFATADTKELTLVKLELQKRHTCTDLGELRSYLGLQITRDRARRTITLTQSHMVHQVLQRFGFRYSSPQSTPLPTGHSLLAPPSDESVEPSGPYPELVGCLMCMMTCTGPNLAYPLSILACYVAPGRHRPEH